MPQESLDIVDRTGLAFESHDNFRPRETLSAMPQFKAGQLVRHPTFGMGRVAEISDMGQHTRAIIDFNAAGRKTLILQYARLEPVA
jgi:DNA helicase-2/ATP-dependent DNA helicase PcrA